MRTFSDNDLQISNPAGALALVVVFAVCVLPLVLLTHAANRLRYKLYKLLEPR